jgi:hypothetical protein
MGGRERRKIELKRQKRGDDEWKEDVGEGNRAEEKRSDRRGKDG